MLSFWDIMVKEEGSYEHCRPHSASSKGSQARKVVTASQTPAQHDSHCEQEGMSADSEPDVFKFSSQSCRSMQAHVHAVAAPVTLPQDHYSWSHIPQESPASVSNFHLLYTMLYTLPL